MRPASLHLIVGSTGAGKTTYSLRFCDKVGAVRFSVDEWMSSLFWMDSPQPVESSWAIERVGRCLTEIWNTAVQIAHLGTPCVLEGGFGTRLLCGKYAALAQESGLSVQIHFLDVPEEERWRRVRLRNEQPSSLRQLDFAITREMFDFTETMWEEPTAQEMADYNGLRITS